jgi:hypothetical protein
MTTLIFLTNDFSVLRVKTLSIVQQIMIISLYKPYLRTTACWPASQLISNRPTENATVQDIYSNTYFDVLVISVALSP